MTTTLEGMVGEKCFYAFSFHSPPHLCLCGMCHVCFFSFLFSFFLFFEKKKKKNSKPSVKTHPRSTHFHFPPFSSQTHFLPLTHFHFPHFLPKPIFFLPPSHRFSPTGTGVTPLLFLLSVCIEMEAKKTQIQRNQAPKTHLCARSAKRWKERVGGGFGCRRQHRHHWFRACQSSATVLGLRRRAPPPP